MSFFLGQKTVETTRISEKYFKTPEEILKETNDDLLKKQMIYVSDLYYLSTFDEKEEWPEKHKYTGIFVNEYGRDIVYENGVRVVAPKAKKSIEIPSTSKVKDIVKSDAREVAKRIAVQRVTTLTREMLIKLLSKTKLKDSIKELLTSPVGKALHGVATSFIVEQLKAKVDVKYSDLLSEISRELRIQAETEISLELVSKLEESVGELFKGEEQLTRIVLDEFVGSTNKIDILDEVETVSSFVPKSLTN